MFAELLLTFVLEWSTPIIMAVFDVAIAAAWAAALATRSVSTLGLVSGIALAVVAALWALTYQTLTPDRTIVRLWSKFTCINAVAGVAVMLAVWR